MNKSGKILIILLIAVILLPSCRSNDDKNRLIPEKDLVDLLTELYIGDGLLVFPSIKTMFSSKDSILNHIDIIRKHGYTKERMDKTMHYYFDLKPKKLENIFDQVLIRLNEKQALIEKEITFRNQTKNNLWKKDTFLNFPEMGSQDPVWFKVEVKDTGTYLIEFSAKIFRDDKSMNPRVTVFFWHGDSSKNENRILWDEVKLPKDGKNHSYSLSEKLTDTTYLYIGGWLLNSDAKKGVWQKHASIENIILRKAESK
jgi:hypothetical protein